MIIAPVDAIAELFGSAGASDYLGEPVTVAAHLLQASVIATTFTPEQARALAAGGNPVFAGMAAMDMHHLPTGHWPMFSRPAALAALLIRIGQQAGRA